MKKVISLLLVALVLVLTGCEFDAEPAYTDYCIGVDDFEFYEATKDSIVGDGKEWRLITIHGDVTLDDDIYENASTFQYNRICYQVDKSDNLFYDYAAEATSVPEPVIEYVDKEVEVEVEVYTHSIIDEDFIAEDGVFFYYVEENIVNLYYKQGIEIYIINFLFEKNLINSDQYKIHSILYFDGTFQGYREVDVEWIDTELSDITELVTNFITNTTYQQVVEMYEAEVTE